MLSPRKSKDKGNGLGSIISKLTSSIKSLSKEGAHYILVGNFATKFVAFFGSIFIARLVSKTELGILSYIENLYSYAYICAGLGLANAVLRFVVLSKDKEKKLAYVEYITKKSIFIDIAIVAIMLAINIFYPHKPEFAIARVLLPVYLISLPFQDRINQSQMNERASFANRRFAFISVLSSAAIVVARIIGAGIGNVTAIVYCIVITNVLFGVILPVATRKKHYTGIKAGTLTAAEKKEASTYSFQYMITNGLWNFFMLMDIYLLGRLLADPAVVADYKIAYAFPANMAIISSAIGIFISPYFVKHETESEWIRDRYIKTFLVSLAAFVSMGVVMFLIARPLILLYGEKYLNVVPLMRVLILGSIVENVYRYPIANILASIGKVKYNMIIAAIGFTIKIILNIVFLPKIGVFAIAYNSIIVQLLMGTALFIVFNREYGILRRNK